MFLRVVFLFGLGLLAAGALAQSAPGPWRSFPMDADWGLIAINGRRLPQDIHAHLRIEAGSGRAFGSTGCNRWTGALVGSEPRLRFTPIAVTRMFCAGAPGEAERHFLSVLNAGPVWRMERGGLVLIVGKTRLRFRRAG